MNEETPTSYWCEICGYEDQWGGTCNGPHAKRHEPREMTPLGEGFDRSGATNE